MIDAAGAIYVIGGANGGTYLYDVWASIDGGARPDSVGGLVGGTKRVLWGTTGVLHESRQGVFRGTVGLLWGTVGVLQGCLGVLEGYLGGT